MQDLTRSQSDTKDIHKGVPGKRLPGPGREGGGLLGVGAHGLLLALSPTQVLRAILVRHLVRSVV